MDSLLARLEDIRRMYGSSKSAERIITELKYLIKLSHYFKTISKDELTGALESLEKLTFSEGAITKNTVYVIEQSLIHLSTEVKNIEMLCVAHAHIDMNWQWGWHETVQTTLDTFQTMLDLMEKYPEFKYSQSQASCYKIVEEHDPEMLLEIINKVKLGQWEVSASTWVEGDRNMVNGEGLFRHYLYARKYLSNLFDLPERDFNFDFEPDTFGHNANIPEILSKCGIKYYYFCRGYSDLKKGAFRWQAPSGNEIIAYAEPRWYMHTVDGKIFDNVAEFCHDNKLKKYLMIYGVGDHGGGPTRRDIENIIEMQKWPLIPTLKFSTYREFYSHLETLRNDLPILKQEMNFVFDGCYTTQSRIKLANRFSEVAMYNAELYGIISKSQDGETYNKPLLEKAWKNVLFNHFHDILPGSGVTETREYALALFQDTLAIANSSKNKSLRAIASMINLDKVWPENDRGDGLSEGAGVGTMTRTWNVSQCERCDGKTRIYHVFNSLPYSRNEAVEVSLWDWNYDKNWILCRSSEGEVIIHQLISEDSKQWGHNLFRILVDLYIPACGYTTLIVTESDKINPDAIKDFNPRLIDNPEFILENDYLKAQFTITGRLTSLINKSLNKEMIDTQKGGAVFRYADEKGGSMSSWTIWTYMSVEELDGRAEFLEYIRGNIRQSLKFQTTFHCSKLVYTILLDKDSKHLEYKCEVDWKEFGKLNESIPNLHFHAALKDKTEHFVNDIAAGIITRPALNHDVPGLSFIYGGGIQLITDCKYGYRGWDNSLSISLIRSAFDPDEHPETGKHYFRFAIKLAEESPKELLSNSQKFCIRPDIVSAYKKTGKNLPLAKSFINLKGEAELSSVKLSENGNGLIVRLYSLATEIAEAELELPKNIITAYEVDGFEEASDFGSALSFSDNILKIKMRPLSTHSIFLEI